MEVISRTSGFRIKYPCADVMCGPGETCVEGECVPEHDPGETCVEGECVPEDLYVGVMCATWHQGAGLDVRPTLARVAGPSGLTLDTIARGHVSYCDWS